MNDYYTYHSNFIIKNQKYLLLELSEVVQGYVRSKGKDTKNITWDYKQYNIFNLTLLHTFMPKMKRLILTYLKAFFQEKDIDHGDGIKMYSWINYHENKQEVESLKIHQHHTDFQGYVCIDPLDSSTIFCNHQGKTEYEIENRTGLIYISESKNLHYVRMNSEVFDRPRVTIGFDVNLVSNRLMSLSQIPNSSVELIFL